MLQPSYKQNYSAPVIQAGDTVLKAADRFCYLGSRLTSAANIDEDVCARLACGRLTKRVWNDHSIQLTAEVAAYKVIVLTTLLYGCEFWTPCC